MRKNINFLGAALVLCLTASQSIAQWSITGTTIHQTLLTNKVHIGATGAGTSMLTITGASNNGDITVNDSYPFINLNKPNAANNNGLCFRTAGANKAWMYYRDSTGIIFSNSSGGATADMFVRAGRVGVNTSSPAEALDVIGNCKVSANAYVGGVISQNSGTGSQTVTLSCPNSNDVSLVLKRVGTGSYDWRVRNSAGILRYENSADDGATYTEYMRMDLNGNVGIGTTSTIYKLNVCGAIRATELRLETGWCDYVFEPDYQLRPLSEVESFIKENKHLPEINPAADVENNGLQVADMSARMIKKIEELTLYMIDADKRIKALEQENKDLKAAISK